jgi:hypothetical protein
MKTLGLALICLVLAVSSASAAQPASGATTLTLLNGNVVVHSASVGDELLGADGLTASAGDLVTVADVGEAALSAPAGLQAHLFHTSEVVIASTYILVNGASYNTVTPDPGADAQVSVSTDTSQVTSEDGSFFVFRDPADSVTWVIVTNGTATVTANGASVVVPPMFFTWTAPGTTPAPAQPGNRGAVATVGFPLPPIEDLSGGELDDSAVLLAPSPGSGEENATTPAPNVPDTATLRAGRTTVWFWPQEQGPLDTVVQDDQRDVHAGDGVNVSDDGRANLNFADALQVQIFRGSRVQMQPAVDGQDARLFLGYALLQGAVDNTIPSGTLEKMAGARVGVRTDWAVITATYSEIPSAAVPWFDVFAAHRVGPTPDIEFLVYTDANLTWVVATKGMVHVEPTTAPPLDLTAGTQAVVVANQSAVTALPALRSEVGSLVPTWEEITNNDLADDAVLSGPVAAQSAPVTASGGPCESFAADPTWIPDMAVQMPSNFPASPPNSRLCGNHSWGPADSLLHATVYVREGNLTAQAVLEYYARSAMAAGYRVNTAYKLSQVGVLEPNGLKLVAVVFASEDLGWFDVEVEP